MVESQYSARGRYNAVIAAVCALTVGIALGYFFGKEGGSDKPTLSLNDAVTIGYRNQAGIQKTATLRVDVINVEEGQLTGYYLTISSPTVEDRRVIRLRPPANWPD